MPIVKNRRARAAAVILFCLLVTSVAAEARLCPSLFVSPVSKTQPRNAFSKFAKKPDDRFKGLVTDRVPITAESLLEAYRHGVFPYDTTPQKNGVWFSPAARGVMDLRFEIGRSDRKLLRKLEDSVQRGELRVSFNEAFEQVMRACAAQGRLRTNPKTHEKEPGPSWISEEIISGYSGLHWSGNAHSVEIWRGDELVGGVYGTLVNGVFTGESMFHKEAEVNKLALLRLGRHLQSRGFTWMDVQLAPPESTSLSVKWGAVEIPREDFYHRLDEANAAGLTWGHPVP
jgi:leucyl/phenylalanyl-tRNA--protein transferase